MSTQPRGKPSTPVRKGRPRGRPHGAGDAAVGAGAIVLATCTLLTQRAPHEVTLALVAESTPVDRSLIRYYFQTRSNLMLSVARHLYAQLKDEFRQHVDSEADAEERIRLSVRALVRFQTRYPYFHRLLLDEIADSREPATLSFMRTITSDGLSHYHELAAGTARLRGIEPFEVPFLYLASVGLSEVFATGSPFLRVAFGEKYDAAAVGRRYEEFLGRFIVDGLRRRPRTPAR